MGMRLNKLQRQQQQQQKNVFEKKKYPTTPLAFLNYFCLWKIKYSSRLKKKAIVVVVTSKKLCKAKNKYNAKN